MFSSFYINRKWDSPYDRIKTITIEKLMLNEAFNTLISKINIDGVCATIDEMNENRRRTLKYIWTGMVVIIIPLISFFAKSFFEDIYLFNLYNMFFIVSIIGLLFSLVIMTPLYFNESLNKDYYYYMQFYKNILQQLKR